jgi:hypothetical protein
MPPDDNSLELDEQSTTLITRARERTAGLRTTAQLPEHKRVALLVTAGPLKGTNFPINKAQVLLGRAQSGGRSPADVVIADSQVSRKHCVLEMHGLTALLVDLDSVNGTFVSGKKIASCELTHLSEFRVGGTTLVLAIT